MFLTGCTYLPQTAVTSVTGPHAGQISCILFSKGPHPHAVGPCHHGMARPQVAERGTASDNEGSCE